MMESLLSEDSLIKIYPLTKDFVQIVKEIEVESGLSAWTIEDYTNEIKRPDSIALIADFNKSVQGFITTRLITLDATTSSAFECEIEVYNLAVRHEARRKGIGQALLTELLVYGQKYNVSKIWLEVRESNYSAVNFYKKNGFEEIYKRKNFYRFPTEDALVLKLKIKVSE